MGVTQKVLVSGTCIMMTCSFGYSQGVAITATGNATPHSSALMDLDISTSSTKKGLLIPRMSFSEMENISSPATSLLVYSTDVTLGFHYYDGSDWTLLSADNLGNHKATNNITLDGYWLSGSGSNDGLKVTTGNLIGIGETSPQAKLHVDGTVRMNDLSGSGTRMVVADDDGDLSTQAIPSGGPGAGSTLYLNLTNDINDLDVSGVSFIHITTDDDHEINGLVGGVLNQIIYLVNPEDEDDVKFEKEEGTQQFIKDFDLKKEEGGIIMFDGTNWVVISKH